MGEIRFVGTGEIRGYLYLVCKKRQYSERTVLTILLQTIYYTGLTQSKTIRELKGVI